MNSSLKYPLWLALMAFLGLAIYALTAFLAAGPGFPLDDAWIHLTYARSLALRGEWAFLPGQPSAGSTSPLWTVLLAPGFWLGLAPYLWPLLLGGLAFFLLAWRFEETLRALEPAYRPRLPWGGFLLLSEWRLAWAAPSGMETIFYALLVFTLLTMLLRAEERWLPISLVLALALWVRPDALTLLGPIFLFLFLRRRFRVASSAPADFPPSARPASPGTLLLAALLPLLSFLLFLAFNQHLAGSPWPNTFYAKQMEYASWQAKPFWEKTGVFLLQFFPGFPLFLLPGLAFLPWRVADTSFPLWKRILPAGLWGIGYLVLYVSRLPLYQYGRYIMPVLPLFLLLGAWGFFRFSTSVHTRLERRLRLAWRSLLLLAGAGFWVLGLLAFRSDVTFINQQMVNTARWSAANLPASALIAAHDIGALGYFDGQHAILDLAGLISPQVISFMNDEAALRAFIRQNAASHLIAFPGWYPALSQGCRVAYQSPYSSPLGAMSIYQCH